MRKFLKDESGFVVSSELVLVLTIAVLGMVVGLASVRDAISQELLDVSDAFGAVSQSYNVGGIASVRQTGGDHASISGFGYRDRADSCDCVSLTFRDVTGKLDSNAGATNEGN